MRLGERVGSPRRGFTLVELMIVVTIVGILAVIGVASLRKYVFSSKSVEAASMIRSIAAAQEQWRAETQSYFDVSGSLDSWYPNSSPDSRKFAWDFPGGNDYANWQLLRPVAPGPVQFGYAVKAGLPGTPLPALETTQQPGWLPPNEPWYVIQAASDRDEDGVEGVLRGGEL